MLALCVCFVVCRFAVRDSSVHLCNGLTRHYLCKSLPEQLLRCSVQCFILFCRRRKTREQFRTDMCFRLRFGSSMLCSIVQMCYSCVQAWTVDLEQGLRVCAECCMLFRIRWRVSRSACFSLRELCGRPVLFTNAVHVLRCMCRNNSHA